MVLMWTEYDLNAMHQSVKENLFLKCISHQLSQSIYWGLNLLELCCRESKKSASLQPKGYLELMELHTPNEKCEMEAALPNSKRKFPVCSILMIVLFLDFKAAI